MLFWRTTNDLILIHILLDGFNLSTNDKLLTIVQWKDQRHASATSLICLHQSIFLIYLVGTHSSVVISRSMEVAPNPCCLSFHRTVVSDVLGADQLNFFIIFYTIRRPPERHPLPFVSISMVPRLKWGFHMAIKL